MCSHTDIISLSVAGYCCHRRCFLLVPLCSLGSCTGRIVLEVDNGRTASPSRSIPRFLFFQLYPPPPHSLSPRPVCFSCSDLTLFDLRADIPMYEFPSQMKKVTMYPLSWLHFSLAVTFAPPLELRWVGHVRWEISNDSCRLNLIQWATMSSFHLYMIYFAAFTT